MDDGSDAPASLREIYYYIVYLEEVLVPAPVVDEKKSGCLYVLMWIFQLCMVD